MLDAVLRMRQEHVENSAQRDEELRIIMEHEVEGRMKKENAKRQCFPECLRRGRWKDKDVQGLPTEY